jgi:U3 small nucleolar RNA-associated protein 19
VTDSENLLGQLLPLTNLPREQVDINAFYLPAMAASPISSSAAPLSKKKKATKKKGKAEIDALPDWMATYESESEEEEETPTGRKRQRTTQMSIHASIHSVQSQTSVYTSLWEAVLGRLSLDDAQTRRILIGLHGDKGILGHMRADRRVRVADWLGGLVDQGGAKAMLAMNGLFVLMTKYNL